MNTRIPRLQHRTASVKRADAFGARTVMDRACPTSRRAFRFPRATAGHARLISAGVCRPDRAGLPSARPFRRLARIPVNLLPDDALRRFAEIGMQSPLQLYIFRPERAIDKGARRA